MTPTVFARIGSLSAAWAPDLLSLARVIFGFLVLRHGAEQVLGYPEPSGATLTSYEGVLELVSLPGGLLLMLGLFTRPVGLVLAVLYGLFWFVGPLHSALTLDHYIFGARASGDETLLNCFFFLYLSAAGPGAWSLDWRRDPEGQAAADSRWAPYALGILRIVGGFLLMQHGLEKWFGGERRAREHQRVDDPRRRRPAGDLRRLHAHGGPLRAAHGIHPVRRDGRGLFHLMGAARFLGQLFNAELCSLHPELLPVPVSLGGRPGSLESRPGMEAKTRAYRRLIGQRDRQWAGLVKVLAIGPAAPDGCRVPAPLR